MGSNQEYGNDSLEPTIIWGFVEIIPNISLGHWFRGHEQIGCVWQ